MRNREISSAISRRLAGGRSAGRSFPGYPAPTRGRGAKGANGRPGRADYGLLVRKPPKLRLNPGSASSSRRQLSRSARALAENLIERTRPGSPIRSWYEKPFDVNGNHGEMILRWRAAANFRFLLCYPADLRTRVSLRSSLENLSRALVVVVVFLAARDRLAISRRNGPLMSRGSVRSSPRRRLNRDYLERLVRLFAIRA